MEVRWYHWTAAVAQMLHCYPTVNWPRVIVMTQHIGAGELPYQTYSTAALPTGKTTIKYMQIARAAKLSETKE